ncbi:MAG: hypothetical protein WC691_09370 [Sulfuricurvum sp.]|jgi:hypothetical protein
MKTNAITIIGLALLALITLGTIAWYLQSPIVSARLEYDPMHFLYLYGSGIGIGIVMAWVLYRNDSTVWFDRIGMSALVLSLAMYALMIVAPMMHDGLGELIAPVIDGKRYLFRFGSVAIEPVFLYLIGLGWLTTYALRGTQQWLSVDRILITGMVLSAVIMIPLYNMNHLFFIEMVLLSMMIRLNGFGKKTIISIMGIVFMFAFLVAGSVHWINRLSQWWDTIIGVAEPIQYDFVLQMPLALAIGVIIAFGALLYGLVRSRIPETQKGIFLDSAIVIIAIDVFLNLSARIGLYPTMPPSLFLIDMNPSMNVAFFVMLWMAFSGTINDKKETL